MQLETGRLLELASLVLIRLYYYYFGRTCTNLMSFPTPLFLP